MAMITCDECEGRGRDDILCLGVSIEMGTPVYDNLLCTSCDGTGKVDVDKADDRDVITALRGVHPYNDDCILSAVIRKHGLDAFSYEALETMAAEYRQNLKRRESSRAPL